MIREYKTVEEISGPLMMVRMVENVTYDELVEIELHDGSLRRGKVLEVNGDAAVVQLFESAAGINLADSKVRFLGHPLQLGVSSDMLGRVFNGMGQPIDGGPELLAEKYLDLIKPIGPDAPSDGQFEAAVAESLVDVLTAKLKEDDSWNLYCDIELRLMPVLL